MKHTKGKFTVEAAFSIDEFGWCAEVMHPEHRGFYAQVSGNSAEEANANAKLVSKAPEMYEALKNMVLISEVYTGMQTNGHFKNLVKLLEEIEP